MKIQLVGFRRAFVWLGAGWHVFKRNLGAWLVMAMVFLLALMVLGMLLVALLGVLASFAFGLGYLVLIPVVTAASYASFRDVFDPVEPCDANTFLNAHSV